MAPDLLFLTGMSAFENNSWRKVPTRNLIGFFVGVGVFVLAVLKCEPGFVFLLDHANLLFHEAGHPAVGLLCQRLTVYGGTLGQLTFPLLLAVSFWRKREAISFAVSVIWFFENWLNIARYMADARTQILPLVGGGCHDWAEMFGRWNVMRHDTQIAAGVRAAGWAGMGAACVWLVCIWWLGRKSPDEATKFFVKDPQIELARRETTSPSSSRSAGW